MIRRPAADTPILNRAVGRLIGMENARGLDGHAHIFDASLPMWAGRRYTPKHSASVDELSGHLRAHGLGGALLTQPSFLGTNNQFLLSGLEYAGEKFPDLVFRGVVELKPEVSVAELRALRQRGVVGARLNLFGMTVPDFSVHPWPQFLRKVDAQDWHLEIYVEGIRLAEVLEQLLHYCRTVVVDHFGLPQVHDPLECPGFRSILRAPAGRVMVKTSAPYRVFPLPSAVAAQRCVDLYRHLREALGAESLVWGSDWPWTCHEGRHDYGDTVGWFREWNA